jgi:hypothetical protein
MSKNWGFGVVLIIFCVITLAVAACTKTGPFESFKNSTEILIKTQTTENKVKDSEKITQIVDLLSQGKPVNPPSIAKGIKPKVTEGTTMFHFADGDFFYIGDGYIYYQNKDQYYSVSKQIETYIPK